MQEGAFDRGDRAPAYDGQLVVLDPHFERLLVHARHLDFQRVAVRIFEHGSGRRDELFFSAFPICGSAAIVTNQSIHSFSFR